MSCHVLRLCSHLANLQTAVVSFATSPTTLIRINTHCHFHAPQLAGLLKSLRDAASLTARDNPLGINDFGDLTAPEMENLMGPNGLLGAVSVWSQADPQ